MTYMIMPKAVLGNWVGRLKEQYRVVGPKEKQGQFIFDEIRSVDELCLHYTPTVLPPKKYLFPPREVLLEYNLDGSRIESTVEPQPTVILGIHTCDLHAIKLLDHVFNQGYVDQHYLANREHTYLVSIECLSQCTEHSFCRDMGTASSADGFDIHILELDNVFALNVRTRKGIKLMDGFHHAFEAMPSDMKRINKAYSEKWERFSYRLDFDVVEMSDLLDDCYESKLWDELGDRCLACGMCTKVCPTCYCFDVTDEADLLLEKGRRLRRWDTCQIDQFALVAGGHNFREKLSIRQRHRFMRKGKYQMDAFGMVGCVGCGRCATSCLVHIRPIEVFNRLREYSQKTGKARGELVPVVEVSQ
ncbi:MAG: 4Fe-4S dicluster domain-containing protein [Candidatus Promineifilaceae bacterium]|nr:4Fe-4S dicluster domain-containing protein [Candidatus Promineifilaceae bacterium]